MKKIIIALLTAAVLIANSAYADGIDVGAAFKDAFISVGLKFLLAYVVFYVLTFSLRGEEKNTALKNGRWYGAILSAVVIASSTNHYSKQSEYIYSLCLAVIGYYVIGFVVGYIWFKFKKVNENKTNGNNSQSKKHLKIILTTIVVIGIGIFFWFFVQSYTEKNSKNEPLIPLTSNNRLDKKENLYDALRKADAAGDVASAKAITAKIRALLKAEKLGSDWKWQQVDPKIWVVNDGFNKNQYGMVNVWLKLELMQKAKEFGTSYSHTISNLDFSCNDATFKVNNSTDIFSDDVIADKVDLASVQAYSTFGKFTENSGTADVYHLVCGK